MWLNILCSGGSSASFKRYSRVAFIMGLSPSLCCRCSILSRWLFRVYMCPFLNHSIKWLYMWVSCFEFVLVNKFVKKESKILT